MAAPLVDEDDILLTVEEVARTCRVNVQTVREWFRSEKLKGHKVGRKWLCSRAQLREFINQNR